MNAVITIEQVKMFRFIQYIQVTNKIDSPIQQMYDGLYHHKENGSILSDHYLNNHSIDDVVNCMRKAAKNLDNGHFAASEFY